MEISPQVSSAPPRRKRYREIHARRKFRNTLAARFPKAFYPYGSAKKPLKVGIFEDIKVCCPDLPWWGIRLALDDYCHGPSYYAAVAAGGHRVNLDGFPVQEITADEIKHAAEALAAFPLEVQKRWEVRAQ